MSKKQFESSIDFEKVKNTLMGVEGVIDVEQIAPNKVLVYHDQAINYFTIYGAFEEYRERYRTSDGHIKSYFLIDGIYFVFELCDHFNTMIYSIELTVDEK